MTLFTITMAWSTKIISHMDGAELLEQVIYRSLMANSKMERDMDTRDILINPSQISMFNSIFELAINEP